MTITRTLAAAIPVDDWQFWVVTLVAAVAVAVLLRGTFKSLRKKKSTRVSLTVNRDKHDA